MASGSSSAFNDGIPLDNNILMTDGFIGEGKLGFIIKNMVHPNLLDGNADYAINLLFIATKRKHF